MKTISKIAYSNDKKNKTRSILIMIAVCLMTMLLMLVGTLGRGMIQLQKENAANTYGSNYGVFLSVSDEQVQELKRHADIDDIGIMRTEGILKGNEKGTFVCVDEKTRKMLPYNREYLTEEGAYPKKGNEIAASEEFFRAQGCTDVKIGDTVRLQYRSGMTDGYHEQEFIVSGILYGRERYTTEASYVVFGTEDFYNSRFTEIERRANIYFTLRNSAEVSMNNIEQFVGNLADFCKIPQENIMINDVYLTWILEPAYEMIVVCGILILGIVLFSIIVIYNIFQVGIAQKIREYGKIKALGASRRQMRQLIFREGMYLVLPSVPVGIVLGFAVAKGGFHWLVKQGNLVSYGIPNREVSLFSPAIIFMSVMISIFSVMLALRKPMKIVSKISPVEAARYSDNSTKRNQGIRKGKKNVSVFSLAMANISGNKKRTLGTIFTMGISCVLFVTISGYTGNIDLDYEVRRSINHGQFELSLDYSFENDEVYPENNLDMILKDNPLNNELIEKLKNIPGVTDVKTREVAVVELQGTKFPVSIVNREDFEKNRWESDIGNMNYDEAVKNGNIFFGWSMWMESDGYALDAPISFEIDNGSGKYAYSGKIAGAFVSADTYLVIPEEVYQSIQPEGTSYGYMWVDCAEKDVASVEKSIRSLVEEAKHLEMKTYHEERQTTEFASRMMRMSAYLFMAILGLIGFMNLVNTMIINITTKKQEYGVLQAVGMTGRQLNRSLQIQGLIFTSGTVVIALSAGLPLGRLLFSYAKQNGIFGMNLYHIPVVPVFIMILLVGGMQMVLSCILSKNLKKETLVERIRYQG